MTKSLHASISLDGKLLNSSGKATRRGIPLARIQEAVELRITIHPLIVGDDGSPTLSGLPGSFLSSELNWKLLSASHRKDGTIEVCYERKMTGKNPVSGKTLRGKRVSRLFPGES
jgi:riboflavin biosynthesis pyrimidine reductase